MDVMKEHKKMGSTGGFEYFHDCVPLEERGPLVDPSSIKTKNNKDKESDSLQIV